MRLTVIFFGVLLLMGCDASKLKEKPDDLFIGSWILQGHGMLDDLRISINKDKEGKLEGRITKLNDNKYVKLFLDSNFVIIPAIERRSNFQFVVTEKKIGSDLFSLYGMDTDVKLQAQFINNNTIVLSSDPSSTSFGGSKVRLIKIK